MGGRTIAVDWAVPKAQFKSNAEDAAGECLALSLLMATTCISRNVEKIKMGSGQSHFIFDTSMLGFLLMSAFRASQP